MASGQEAVRLDSDFTEAILRPSMLITRFRDYDGALFDLKRALQQLPDSQGLIHAFVDAAMSLAEAGEGQRVSELLEGGPTSAGLWNCYPLR